MQNQRTRGPRPLGDLIRDFVREQGLGTTRRGFKVFDAWTEAMGPDGDGAEPVRFRNGELVVEVSSTVRMHELKSFSGEGYRRKANEKLGGDPIRKVTFKLKG